MQRLSQPELSMVLFQNYVNKPQVELKCKLNRIQNLNRFDFYMNIIIKKKIQSLNMNFCIFGKNRWIKYIRIDFAVEVFYLVL